MAWAPLVLSIVGTVMQVGAQQSAAAATKQQGQQLAVNKEFEAAQLDQAGGQEFAASQRAAHNERRRAELVASRALAVGGASGGGLSDPTMLGILSDISGEGALRAATALYEGESRQQGLETKADVARNEGVTGQLYADAKASGMRTASYGTFLQGLGTSALYAKYGGGGPKSNVGALDQYSLFSGTGMTDPRYG